MNTVFKPYLIQCLTNLHAGSGDAGYGIIDKMVQRDPVSNYPTIHASSLKGGLREHFEHKWKDSYDENTRRNAKVEKVFGTERTDDNASGSHSFLNADLVALPIRCTYRQFALAFDKTLAEFINNKVKYILGKDFFNMSIFNNQSDRLYGGDGEQYAEDYKLQSDSYKNPFCFDQTFITGHYAYFKPDHFSQLVKNLPVIARNKVGIDKNLWYEEIVPHQTLFLTFIGESSENQEFDEALANDLIQIGGNASVGYGLCKFHPINF